jgi:hypothetical protein
MSFDVYISRFRAGRRLSYTLVELEGWIRPFVKSPRDLDGRYRLKNRAGGEVLFDPRSSNRRDTEGSAFHCRGFDDATAQMIFDIAAAGGLSIMAKVRNIVLAIPEESMRSHLPPEVRREAVVVKNGAGLSRAFDENDRPDELFSQFGRDDDDDLQEGGAELLDGSDGDDDEGDDDFGEGAEDWDED